MTSTHAVIAKAPVAGRRKKSLDGEGSVSAAVQSAPHDLYARALRGAALYLRDENGRRTHLPVERWLGEPAVADERVLRGARGPVLDIGCGPGRHVVSLERRGVRALGVDIAPAAVLRARDRGASVVLSSIFDPIPASGHWRTALLLDGNLGIGGNPAALLRRVRELLRLDGIALCELDAPGTRTRHELVALEEPSGARSEWFPWARVSVDSIATIADRAGMRVGDVWQDEERWFAALTVYTPTPGMAFGWRARGRPQPR